MGGEPPLSSFITPPASPPSSSSPRSPRTTYVPVSLMQPSLKKKKRPIKAVRIIRALFRSFPIFTPACKMPALPSSLSSNHRHISAGNRVTGTIFGYRKGKVTLSIQETPRCFPTVVIELAMQTSLLQKEMNLGMVRIALECEKRSEKDRVKIMQEPVWTMFCNGKKTGYGVKRDATEEDLVVMELLKNVSMGAGVLPGNSEIEGVDGELAYMRAHFEHVVGSKDSETLYMFSPLGNNGPELSIFFVRV